VVPVKPAVRRIFCCSLIALAFLHPVDLCRSAELVLRDAPVAVYFSPHGGAERAIVSNIETATESISVQAYSFTSPAIVTALVGAYKRGLQVEIILDKSQRSDPRSGTGEVIQAGIPTFIDSRHAIAHNKVIIIDNHWVITGSFNFTKSAEERNAENLLIIDSRELARLYQQDWVQHVQHAKRQQWP